MSGLASGDLSVVWFIGATLLGSVGNGSFSQRPDSIPLRHIPLRNAYCEVVTEQNQNFGEIRKAFIRTTNNNSPVFESAPQGKNGIGSNSFGRVDKETLRTVAIDSRTGEALGPFDVVTKKDGKQSCIVTERFQSRLVYNVASPAR